MLETVDFFYFSPTGGTKRVGEILASSMAKFVKFCDLGCKKISPQSSNSDVAIIAVPVFGGRIPSLIVEKLRCIDGKGKQAVTLVVYGNRAFEDSLLELNNLVESLGFGIVASGAFIAQHSIVPEVGANRPDDDDVCDLKDFAKKVVDKIKSGANKKVEVSGNYPYKPDFSMPVAPLSLSNCNLCSKCITVCPTDAISLVSDSITTDVDKCIFCVACVRVCRQSARILPPPVQEKVSQMLAKFKNIRAENEVFL